MKWVRWVTIFAVLSVAIVLATLGGLGMFGAQGSDDDDDGDVVSVDVDVVEVDLQPCILTTDIIGPDLAIVSEAYMLEEFFKGFWAPSQYHLIAPGDELDLTVDGDEYHGRCNAVFVSIVPTPIQQETLKAYSQRFQARVVYFSQAETADDDVVMSRLGLSEDFVGTPVDISVIKLTGNASPRVVNSTLQTAPKTNGILTQPIKRISAGVGGTTTVVADYADSNGASLVAVENGVEYPSVAAATYTGDDGEEEMHVFFAMAWFDVGSWAWVHYIVEWATKGIFAGERRFWLGATVDDLFLKTAQFEYGAPYHQGEHDRMNVTHMSEHLAAVSATNARYNAELITEFAFNGNGILEKVGSPFTMRFANAQAGLLAKGELPTVNPDGTLGIEDQLNGSWWTQSTIESLEAEFQAGNWSADDLTKASVEHKDDFFWQSHTMNHLSRDNLGESDCAIEDGGFGGFQILPRYPTNIYYNCITTECSILENLHIRRTVCGCADTNPGVADNLNLNTTGCDMVACPAGLEPLGTAENLFAIEAEITSRYIMNGRRDKYMFHQLNVIPTSLPDGHASLLDGWYEAVLSMMSKYLNLRGDDPFPVRSVKFDDLCTNFKHHEELDGAEATVTMTLMANGTISGMYVSGTRGTGAIRITVPSSMESKVNLDGLPAGQPYAKETYGSDVTYYVATSEDDIPIRPTVPSAGELAPVPL